MARVDLIDPNESEDPDVREFAPKVTHPDGSVGGHFAAETHFPEVMLNVYDARLALARKGDLGIRLFTKLAVAISMANECTYCVGAYSSQLGRQLGGDEAAKEFQRSVRNGDLDGKESDAIDFAFTILNDPHDVSDEDFEHPERTTSSPTERSSS